MKKPVTVLSLLLALAGVLPRAAVAADAPQPLSAQQSLASFDAAWKLVGESPYDVRGKGLDWDAIGTRYRAQAEAVRDREGLHRVINAMLDEIGESHFGLIPATLVELGDSLQQAQEQSAAPIAPGFHDSGIEARIIDDAMRIVRVRADSAGAQAGIRPGWRIETVDGVHLGEALEKLLKLPADHQRLPRQRLEALVRARLGAQSPAAPARLQLRDADDQPHELRLEPGPTPGTLVNVPMLPPLMFHLESSRLGDPGDCVGLIRFNVWAPALAEAFPRALDQVRDCGRLLIDLRGNPGGVIGTAMGVGGWLVETATPLGEIRAGGSAARLPALPRRVGDDGTPREPYTGPLAILIDGHSASTSEVFASGMQVAGRAAIVGTASSGMALPSQIARLPSGDQLLYAVADLVAPDGERLEGRGIQPDISASDSAASLRAGHDRALEAALAWLRAPTPLSPSTAKE
ncbi:S41 family peptidase [Luteimonas sp. e5]